MLPLAGIIDGSVLTVVGELLMFGVIAQIPRILDAARNGKSFKFQKGDSSVEISAKEPNEEGSLLRNYYRQGSMLTGHRTLLFDYI